jgi:hypothetical protein
MDLIAYATDLVHEPTPVKGAKLESLTFTTPAEPSFPHACGTHSGTAGVLGGVAASGLVYLVSSDTFNVDTRAARIHRMRVGICSTARVLETSFQREGRRYRKAFITLTYTYREGDSWNPRHITETLNGVTRVPSPSQLPIAAWYSISVQTAVKYKRNILKPSKKSVALFRLHADKRIIPEERHINTFTNLRQCA